jgi:hypothetical protein
VWLAAAAILLLLLLLLLGYCAFYPRTAAVERGAVPLALGDGPLLALDDAVVSGFSGTRIRTVESSDMPMGQRAVEQTFIDTVGPAVRIINARAPGFVWNGTMWVAPQTHTIDAATVGQVFGIALDDAAHPNIYLAATSVYGLNLVERPRDEDEKRTGAKDDDDNALPRRLRTGSPRAQWMEGQFGRGGGAGSIWKIDGRTGQVRLFASIVLAGEGSGAAALGNLAYDPEHHQIFVSDLSTGMIHRLDMAGRDLGHFDHGRDGRRAAKLDEVAYDASTRIGIADSRFNPEQPNTWGFAATARRVWGIAVHDHRLYYAVADGHIWSIGLDKNGAFVGEARKDIDLPAGDPPVSDIVFSHDGAMIVAERAVIGTRFDYSPLPGIGTPHVYRFWPERPDDPATPTAWYQQPEEYAVGFAQDARNSGGGIDLGYGYKILKRPDDKIDVVFDFDDCEEAIFFTGGNLRGFRQTKAGFVADGPLRLNGLQISPSRPVRGFNAPANISYFVNYGSEMDSRDHRGAVGGVRVYRLDCGGACPLPREGSGIGAVTSSPPPPAGPPGAPPPGAPPPGNPPPNSGDCVGPNCAPPCSGADCPIPCVGAGCPVNCVGPDCPCIGTDCPNSNPKVCMEVSGEAVCDPSAGGWVYKLNATDPLGLGIDTVSAYSRVPGVSVSNGPQISLMPPPGEIQLSGSSPGQLVTIDVCGFNSADPNYKQGKPYDCCRQTLHVRVPRGVCKANEGPTQ